MTSTMVPAHRGLTCARCWMHTPKRERSIELRPILASRRYVETYVETCEVWLALPILRSPHETSARNVSPSVGHRIVKLDGMLLNVCPCAQV